uniref:Putative cnidarian restricted protein n=1 Tax=Clytia hemisphaerica TaxID=252671 RepID=A0A069DMX1_9CNID
MVFHFADIVIAIRAFIKLQQLPHLVVWAFKNIKYRELRNFSGSKFLLHLVKGRNPTKNYDDVFGFEEVRR